MTIIQAPHLNTCWYYDLKPAMPISEPTSDYSGATRKLIARKAVAPWRRFGGAHRCALEPINGMPVERRQSRIDSSLECLVGRGSPDPGRAGLVGRGSPDPAQASTEGRRAFHPSIQSSLGAGLPTPPRRPRWARVSRPRPGDHVGRGPPDPARASTEGLHAFSPVHPRLTAHSFSSRISTFRK